MAIMQDRYKPLLMIRNYASTSHTGSLPEARPGCAQAAHGHHGPLQAGAGDSWTAV